MSDYGRRLIVQRSFDRTLWSLIEALIREGFFLKACDVRKLPRRAAGRNLRRCVLLQAAHPDGTGSAPERDHDAGPRFACDIAVDECADGQTAVTIKLAHSLEDRVRRALDTVGHGAERWTPAA
jgi:hypothetical protein